MNQIGNNFMNPNMNMMNPNMNMMNPNMNMMNQMNMMNPNMNLMNPNMMMNLMPQNQIFNNFNPDLGQNFVMQNYVNYTNLMLENKMNFLFHQMNPQFNQFKQEDNEMKTKWENEFLYIFRLLNQMKSENKKNDYEKGIIFNFYDICSKEVYCDLNLNLEYIISVILSKLYNKEKRYIKRTNKNQTTKYVIENPNIIIENYNKFFDIECDPLYFEFGGINLFSMEKKMDVILV